MRENRKVSADFHVDLNHEVVRKMLSGSGSAGAQGTPGPQENGLKSPVEKRVVDCQLSQDLENWLCFPKQVLGELGDTSPHRNTAFQGCFFTV